MAYFASLLQTIWQRRRVGRSAREALLRSQSKLTILAVAALISCAPSGVSAHGGRTNAQGCHTNRSTGEYHCHNGGSASRANGRAPARGEARLNGSSAAYVNCTAARAAGAAPVRRGDPGYGAHLDRDNDGIGCER